MNDEKIFIEFCFSILKNIQMVINQQFTFIHLPLLLQKLIYFSNQKCMHPNSKFCNVNCKGILYVQSITKNSILPYAHLKMPKVLISY